MSDDAPSILNAVAGPVWAPIELIARVDAEDRTRSYVGMGRNLFAVVCREANGEKPLQMDGSECHIEVMHLPTGARVASATNGARGYEIADALEQFPEFGLPLDIDGLESRAEEIRAAVEKAGGKF